MKKFILTLFILFISVNIVFCATTNSYDQYESKTGLYRQSGNTINKYDKYGSKTGSFKQTASGYNSYDRYGTNRKL